MPDGPSQSSPRPVGPPPTPPRPMGGVQTAPQSLPVLSDLIGSRVSSPSAAPVGGIQGGPDLGPSPLPDSASGGLPSFGESPVTPLPGLPGNPPPLGLDMTYQAFLSPTSPFQPSAPMPSPPEYRPMTPDRAHQRGSAQFDHNQAFSR